VQYISHLTTMLIACVALTLLGNVGTGAFEAPQQPTAASAAADKRPVRVGGAVKMPLRTRHVPPVYPAIAQAARVQGVVIVETTVGSNGKVVGATIVKSIPLLDAAAIEAVKQWEFAPTVVNGAPVSVVLTTTVTFALDAAQGTGTAQNRPTAAPPATSQPATGTAQALRNLQEYVRREEFTHPQQPAASADIQFDTMGVEFGPWVRRFVAQLKGNWMVSSAAQERGRTGVRFQVHRNGRITDVSVVTSSKRMILDMISQRAVQASDPAEPLPADYKNDFAVFTVTFTYNEPGKR
jgi:TonB family protein